MKRRISFFLAHRLRQTNALLEELIGANSRAIHIDFPPKLRPRYGYANPPHAKLLALIEHHRNDYLALLAKFESFASSLARITAEPPDDPTQPFWNNGWIGGTNAIALYCLPAIHQSKRYVEIGSGNSTKFVRRSITDHGLPTTITSIDPHPRSEIDQLCDTVCRFRLEDTDLSIFDQLEAGDILVLDGSHRVFQNSDVTVFFLDVLPHLPAGVIVYIDDVYLPYDYPPEWTQRYYSEQYLLAVLLLADAGRRYDVMLPHIFIERDPELSARERKLWQSIGHDCSSGNGFWIRTVGR